MQTTGTTHSPYYLGEAGDTAFKSFALAVQMTLGAAGTRLFAVDTAGLFEFFLASFEDPVERQYHNCHCCKNFITRYGGLVTLDPHGSIQSAVWDVHQVIQQRAPDQYQRVALQMKKSVESAKVVGQFFPRESTLGVPEAGGFSHFSAPGLKVPELHLMAGQLTAARKEDHKHLSIAIVEMKPELVNKAIAMLQAGGLIRPEAILPMGKFLQQVQELTVGAHGEKRSRILWDAVGRAAPGWCTPRASAFGALVEDIALEKSTAAITHAHNVRLDPMHYLRPQAAPSAGNIKEAERLFEKLGLAPALRRRPMALEEAELFWRPRVSEAPKGEGVFGHLQPKGSGPVNLLHLSSVTQAMTFAKFQRDILPQALEMRAQIPNFGAFCALTTATDPAAPPILQWDSLEKRNPGAWYLHAPGGRAEDWSLSWHTWVDVLGLSKLPPDWYGNDRFHFKTTGRVVVILRGAKDIRRLEGGRRGGLALFPECLKSELHSVRSTIEAFSVSRDLDEELRPRASGWLLSDEAPLMLEVTTEHGKAKYSIDRME